MLRTSEHISFELEMLLFNVPTQGAEADLNGGKATMLSDIRFITIHIGITFLLGPD